MTDAKRCDNCREYATSTTSWLRIGRTNISANGTMSFTGGAIAGDYCSEDCIIDRIAKRKQAAADNDRRYQLMNAIDKGDVTWPLGSTEPTDAA